jgi:hypothetical protein
MRLRAAAALLSLTLLAACTREPVGPAAPIAPAQVTPAPALDASAAREAVVEFVEAYRDSPNDGTDHLMDLVAGPDLASWAKWLGVQNREFDGTIEGAADVRDVEFVGAVNTPRASGASVGLSASVGFRFTPTGEDPFDRVRILDGPVTLVRTSPGTYRVLDLTRDGVPMSDSIQPFRKQTRTEGDVTVTLDSLFMFNPSWQFNVVVENRSDRDLRLDANGAALFHDHADGFDRVEGDVVVTPSLLTVPAGATVEGMAAFRAQPSAADRVFSLLYTSRNKPLRFPFPLGDIVTQVPPPPPTDGATVSGAPS